MTKLKQTPAKPIPGISVITCTNRPHFMHHMFQNYRRQKWGVKEWIIVLNMDRVDINRYKKIVAKHEHIRVYQVPARRSLGYCLNFASARTKHSYIAKFDDDEYYASLYLHGMMNAFRKSRADVVGKRSYFIHLEGKNMIIQRYYAHNQFVRFLAGGTLVYKRKVWEKVKFPNRTHGEDTHFCIACRRSGFKLYAADRYNFCALRRKQPNSHTWKVTDQQFLSHPQTKIIARNVRGGDYKKYVLRPLHTIFKYS